MVRIYTEYDKDLNEKVFVVRGDENYARTTDTTVQINTFNNSEDSVLGYRIGVTLNVLRDVGKSSITLFDGDDVLGMYDYNDETGSITIGDSTSGGFLLTYDVPHLIWAKYNGNSQCLASKSKVQSVTYPLPTSHSTQIAFSNADATVSLGGQYQTNLTVTKNGSSSSLLYDLDILIYFDDEYLGTVTTSSSSNVASLTLDALPVGMHTVKAEVLDSENLHHCISSTRVAVGYNLSFTKSPSIIYSNVSNTYEFRASVNDLYGDGMNTGTAYLTDLSNTNLTSASVSQGGATFNYTGTNTGFKVKYNNSYSSALNIDSGTVGATTIATGSDIIKADASLPIRVSVMDSNNHKVPNVTVNVSAVQGNSTIWSRNISTGDDGIATTSYTGVGRGDITLVATYNNQSTAKVIGDYVQYAHLEWNDNVQSRKEVNFNYRMYLNPSSTTPLSNQIEKTSQGYQLKNTLIFPKADTDYGSNNIEFTTTSYMTIKPLVALQNGEYHTIITPNESSIYVSNGKNVKIEYSAYDPNTTGGTAQLYVNNTLKRTYTFTYSNIEADSIGFLIEEQSGYMNDFRITKRSE